MVERTSPSQHLKFKCLSCGEKLKTYTRTEDWGNCESGNNYVQVEYYSRQNDAYFIRFGKYDFLDLFRKIIDDSIEVDRNKLKAEVEKAVSSEEYQKIVLAVKGSDIGLEFRVNYDNLASIALELREQKWEDTFFKISRHGHSIHYDCAKPLFEKASNIEELKYIIEGSDKKLLKAKITTDSGTLLDVLGFFRNYVSEHIAPPYLENPKQVNFEIAYFSEYL